MNIKALVFFFFIVPVILIAQNPFHRVYDTKYSIPSAEAYDCIQDDDGYLWFSTDHGLVRFDGYLFRAYGIEDGLPENSVFIFRKDDKGRIWFNSFGGKLAYIEKGKIVPYAYNEVLDSLMRARNTTRSSVFLSYYVDDRYQAHVFMANVGNIEVDSLGRLSEKKDPPNQNLQLMFDPMGKAYFEGPKDLVFDSVVVQSGQSRIAVSLSGIEKNLRIGRNLFALKLDQKVVVGYQFSALLIGPQGEEKIFKCPHYIVSVDMDSSGQIWLLTLGGGSYIFDKELNLLHHYFEGESFTGFEQDHEGGIWLSSLNNGFFYIPTTDHFALSAEAGLPNELVVTIEYDDRAQLWIAYADGQIIVLKNDKTTQLNIKLRPYEKINEMAFDECNRRIWLGTNMRLLYSSVLQKKFFEVNPSYTSDLSFFDVRSMDFDPVSCKLWLGGYGGISHIQNTGKMQRFKSSYNNLFKERFEALEIGQDHCLWVGTSIGLYRLCDSVLFFYGDKYPISKNRITALHFSADTLWIGTRGYGLFMLARDTLMQFTTTDGLPSNSVNAIGILNRKLLVGTNEGLALLALPISEANKSGIKTMGYRELVSKQIEKIIVGGDSVFVATKLGISILRNLDKPSPAFEMPLHIREVFVENRPVGLKENLRIPYNENSITIEYFGISLIKTGKLTYRHRLVGLEEDWVENQQIVAQYPYLPAGSYRFEVEVRHAEGHWSASPATFSFVVLKPFWYKWEFILFAGIVTIALFVIGVRLYGRSKIRHQRLLSDINWYQQEAFVGQMNPHFMFNALNTVQKFILENDKMASIRYLNVFARLMRRVLEQARIKESSLESEQDLLNLYVEMESVRFDNYFEYTLTTDPYIDKKQTVIPVFLIQPLVENAIKHGLMNSKKHGKLGVRFLLKNENDLLCEVEDNGIGRKAASEIANTLGKTSAGLSILQNRISLINQRSNSSISLTFHDLFDEQQQASGTLVSLLLPAKIVKIPENG